MFFFISLLKKTNTDFNQINHTFIVILLASLTSWASCVPRSIIQTRLVFFILLNSFIDKVIVYLTVERPENNSFREERAKLCYEVHARQRDRTQFITPLNDGLIIDDFFEVNIVLKLFYVL